jgi:hypothetical protein
MNKLKKNDIVCLRSPKSVLINKEMKVEDINYFTNKVICSWLNEHGRIETGIFNTMSLRQLQSTIKNK